MMNIYLYSVNEEKETYDAKYSTIAPVALDVYP